MTGLNVNHKARLYATLAHLDELLAQAVQDLRSIVTRSPSDSRDLSTSIIIEAPFHA